MKPHQASVVAIAGRAVIIEGPTGSGKSSLALALIDRGAQLIGDDSVLLNVADNVLMVYPHPLTRGLLEVRNLGLIDYPVCESAPVSLIVQIDDQAERFIDSPLTVQLLDQSIPKLRLWPDDYLLALKVELALQQYGLS